MSIGPDKVKVRCLMPLEYKYLIGRYGGLTGKTWVKGVGNKFLFVGIFGLAKRRKMAI